MNSVRDIWLGIQESLFPFLERGIRGQLTDKLKQLVRILELLRIEDFTVPAWTQWMGRKRCDRQAIARAFVAKAVLDVPTTQGLVDLLRRDTALQDICGFRHAGEVPSASTFSRAFAEFADEGLTDAVLNARVDEHVGDSLVHHVSRDSTEVSVRQKAARKQKATEQADTSTDKPKKKRGRPKKGEVRELPEPTRLQKQVNQSAEEALAELPTAIDYGCKTDSNGKLHYWKGVKFHIEWIDRSIPVSGVTTSASLHDSQAAIPMMKRTARRLTSCYDLMDSAYDADPIHQVSRELGHVPIIDIHPRRTSAPPFDPATAQRYKVRTEAERGNSRLKDEFGARHVRVRGCQKVHTHLMFGLLALFADQLFKVFM